MAMRTIKLLVPLILICQTAFGAVAFDAFTAQAQTTGDFTISHTPAGTPRGAIVYVIMNGAAITVSSVTYGGQTMTETASSPVSNITGELGSSHCFFLGTGIPAGTQNVVVDVLLGTEVSVGGVVTLTADSDTSVVTTGSVLSDNTTTTTTTLSLGGVSSFVMTGFWSGLNQITNITPLTGWTERLENDYGAATAGIYTYDTVGTTDVSAGYANSGGDDAAMHAIAVRENAVAGIKKGLAMVIN